MRINRGVIRAIRNRQTGMTVRTDTSVLTRGVMVDTLGVPVVAKGCFQQINRFDNFLGDELKQMTEGERLEASTVLWTEHRVQRGTDDAITEGTFLKADIVVDLEDGVVYKVLAVRNKRYGRFYRAILSEVTE